MSAARGARRTARTPAGRPRDPSGRPRYVERHGVDAVALHDLPRDVVRGVRDDRDGQAPPYSGAAASRRRGPACRRRHWPRPALAVTGLRKAYGSWRRCAGVDLQVGRGELVGLLGPNGAGKSTLVKVACGLVRPTAGGVAVCGAPAGSPAAQQALGYLAELFRFPEWCTRRRAAGPAPAARGLDRRRRRAAGAARARRARASRRPAHRHDVQGDAAAAGDRPGAGRLAAAAAARRADERARPRRPAHGARAAGASCASARSACCSTRTC